MVDQTRPDRPEEQWWFDGDDEEETEDEEDESLVARVTDAFPSIVAIA